MIKTAMIAALSALIAAPASGQWDDDKADRPPVSREYQWVIRSACSERIHVAVYYAGPWDWQTRGWYNLAPGETLTFTVTRPDVALYAYSRSHRWTGRSDGGPVRYIDIDRRFDYEGDDVPTSASDEVRFFWASVDGDTRINCD